jgi:protein SCO1/2
VRQTILFDILIHEALLRPIKKFLFNLTAVSVLVLPTASCGSRSSPSEASKEPPKQFHLHGEIVKLDPQDKTATINAQKIEGWMEAMSMEYPVKDAQDFSKLQPNECIDATVFVQGTEYWVGDVKPAETAPGSCVAAKAANK